MTTSTDWSREADELGSLIARSRRRVWSHAARRLESQGDSMLVWQLLNALRRDGPMTQRDLAFRVGQHPAGVSRLLDVLERRKQVRRRRDPRDRRKLEVALTNLARQHLAEMDPHVAAASEQVLSPLSIGELRTLRRLLAKLGTG
jgi:DNA-binding MarR family transcriptional regulator